MKTTSFERKGMAARLPLVALVLALAASEAIPARAQEAGTTAPAPTPTPAPGRSIDFRLPDGNDGRQSGVQGPADNGIPPLAPGEARGQPTPAPAPTPTAPRIVPTQPSTATPAPASTPTPAPTPAPTRRAAPEAAPPASTAAEERPDIIAGTEPGVDDTPPATAMPSAASPADDGEAPRPATPSGGSTPLWAWLIAALAATAAGFWYWRRRPALAGGAPAEDAEPAAAEPPIVTSPPAPAAPDRAPAPAPRPVAVPRAASPLVTRAPAEQRAQISMALGIRALRMTPESLSVGFTLELTNNGLIPATGLMIRIALGQGSAMQEGVLGRFFDGAGGSVMRDDIEIAPGASEQFNTEVNLPRAGIEPLVIAGKPMLVPVLVFDVTYHWEGDADSFGQTAGSYVLGRAPVPGTGDRLAPLPLERLSYAVDRPGARATAMRRTL